MDQIQAQLEQLNDRARQRAVSLAEAVRSAGGGDTEPMEQLQHQQDNQLEVSGDLITPNATTAHRAYPPCRPSAPPALHQPACLLLHTALQQDEKSWDSMMDTFTQVGQLQQCDMVGFACPHSCNSLLARRPIDLCIWQRCTCSS